MIKWLAIIAALIFCGFESYRYGYEQGQIAECEEWTLRGMQAVLKIRGKEYNMTNAIKNKELKWTLTEDRLPEKEGDYLVTITMDHRPFIFILGFHNGKFFGDRGDEPNNKRILAWMPLPEPYTIGDNKASSACKSCKETRNMCAFCIPPDKE